MGYLEGGPDGVLNLMMQLRTSISSKFEKIGLNLLHEIASAEK